MAAPFNIRARLRSFIFAWHGIRLVLMSQHNAWIHCAITFAALIAGFVFHLSRMEWCAIVLSIMTVWTAESLNTSLEFLCDVASPEFHPLVEKAKDAAAAAVLLSAAGSVVVGLLVFVPHISATMR